MTQCNSGNIRLSNSQASKLKSGTKTEIGATWRLSWCMIGINKTNFRHKLLLTDREVQNLCKTFSNHLSINTKLSKIQISKII